ncbi:MAG TPA: hypothetical protein VMF08_08475 [Candidatus Sulfotelmatobacter sp.]|nr:hypothetical protein [Candidatus Sulfotelmatobacter sp.]
MKPEDTQTIGMKPTILLHSIPGTNKKMSVCWVVLCACLMGARADEVEILLW